MSRLSSFTFLLLVLSGATQGLAQGNHDKQDNLLFQYPVYEGRMTCDDKVFVAIVEDRKIPNNFDVLMGKAHYKTKRVPTDSGAIRLEDKLNGVVWLQMSNKSMLLHEKAGKRLANNCRNALQLAVDAALVTSNAATVLDAPANAKP